MSKIQTIKNFCKQHKIISTLIAIATVDVLLLVASYIALGVFTHHGDRETVPDLKGKTVEEAVSYAAEHHMQLEITDSTYVESVRPGTVIEQNPSAGSFVKSGRTIYVTIRTYSTKLIRIPALTDMSVRQGESILRSAGVKNIVITKVPSEFADLVYEVKWNGSTLHEGSKIPMDATVTLVVGDGSLSGYVEEDLSGNSDSLALDEEVYEEEL